MPWNYNILEYYVKMTSKIKFFVFSQNVQTITSPINNDHRA